jgi:hypothetical protein
MSQSNGSVVSRVSLGGTTGTIGEGTKSCCAGAPSAHSINRRERSKSSHQHGASQRARRALACTDREGRVGVAPREPLDHDEDTGNRPLVDTHTGALHTDGRASSARRTLIRSRIVTRRIVATRDAAGCAVRRLRIVPLAVATTDQIVDRARIPARWRIRSGSGRAPRAPGSRSAFAAGRQGSGPRFRPAAPGPRSGSAA